MACGRKFFSCSVAVSVLERRRMDSLATCTHCPYFSSLTRGRCGGHWRPPAGPAPQALARFLLVRWLVHFHSGVFVRRLPMRGGRLPHYTFRMSNVVRSLYACNPLELFRS